MSLTHPTPLHGIDDILAELPRDWVVGMLGQARLVIGPCGAFVLVPGGVDLTAEAEWAQGLASHTRTALAGHVSWVPFIDAAIVTTTDHPALAEAVVVPVDLLGELLIEGPPVIDETALALLRDLLVAGSLDGWREANREVDVSIDLCEPNPPSVTRAHL